MFIIQLPILKHERKCTQLFPLWFDSTSIEQLCQENHWLLSFPFCGFGCHNTRGKWKPRKRRGKHQQNLRVTANVPEVAVGFLRTSSVSVLRYVVTWKSLLQANRYSPALWQPWTKILSWTDPASRHLFFWFSGNALALFSDYCQLCRLRLAISHLWYCCLFFLFAKPLFCTYFTHIFLQL